MAKVKVIVLCLFVNFFFVHFPGFAQTDSDSLRLITPVDDQPVQVIAKKRYDPRRATLLSAAFPSLGQIYNRQYWKLPIIYAGAGTLGYFLIDNTKKYTLWRDRYIAQRLAQESGKTGAELPVKSSTSGNPIPLEQLKNVKDQYRRYRDLTIVLSGLAYVLVIADANVFAHLKGFELSENLAMTVKPGMIDYGGALPGAGVTVSLRLK